MLLVTPRSKKMPSQILNPDYIWDRGKDLLTKIYKTKIEQWANTTPPKLKNKLEKREDLNTVNFVAILHNGESDMGETEAWERTTVINSNNFHQDHYLIMELARGYLNPHFSGWVTIPIHTKDPWKRPVLRGKRKRRPRRRKRRRTGKKGS
jgi:hypothetical protein